MSGPTRRTPVKRISAKKLAKLNGKVPFSSVTSPRKGVRKKAKKRDRNDRERIYGPQTFRDFLHAQPCLVCRYFAVEQAHLGTGGMGRKDDWPRTGPLCGPHQIVSVIGARLVQGCHADYDNHNMTRAQRRAVQRAQQEFWQRWVSHCEREGLDPHTGAGLTGREADA